MRVIACLAAFILSAPAHAIQASSVDVGKDAEKSSFDNDVHIITKFFVPNGLKELGVSSCEHSYRRKLDTTPEDQELENAIPGIHDVMVKTALEYCAKNVPAWLKAKQTEVGDYWRKKLTPSEARKLSQLFFDAVSSLERNDFSAKRGETAVNAVDREVGAPQPWEIAFVKRLTDFVAEPANRQLWQQIVVYHAKIQTDIADPEKGSVRVLSEALYAASQSANEYAISKGFAPPYP